MAQLIVRNLDEHTKAHLKAMAQTHGVSLEHLARTILRTAAQSHTASPKQGLGTKISQRFQDTPLDKPLPELHGSTITPMSFDS